MKKYEIAIGVTENPKNEGKFSHVFFPARTLRGKAISATNLELLVMMGMIRSLVEVQRRGMSLERMMMMMRRRRLIQMEDAHSWEIQVRVGWGVGDTNGDTWACMAGDGMTQLEKKFNYLPRKIIGIE